MNTTASIAGEHAAARHPGKAFVIDFALGLMAFSAMIGIFSIAESNAFPVLPPAELLGLNPLQPSPAAFVPALTEVAPAPFLTPGIPTYVVALFALTFASLTAFNLAVWRHLRTAYASPRRSA